MKLKYSSICINHLYCLFYELSLKYPPSKILNYLGFPFCVWCFSYQNSSETVIFHITGKFKNDTIWDFIRDVFKFNDINLINIWQSPLNIPIQQSLTQILTKINQWKRKEWATARVQAVRCLWQPISSIFSPY